MWWLSAEPKRCRKETAPKPTDVVDPVGCKQIRELLLAERARGVTIFINSHLLGEIE
jgi:ABC-type uncharacterized transport system ATPase subunit